MTTTKANAKKAAALGMPFGTACARLKKNILFQSILRLNENICFHCGERIESVDELSIEHKIPWLGNPELFWDTENIAFSHLSCNCKAGNAVRINRPIPNRTIPLQDGKKWCPDCQDFLPIDLFNKNSDMYHGVDTYCRRCKKTRAKRYSGRT